VCANIQKNSAKKIIVFVAATNVCSNHEGFIHKIGIFFLIRFEDCRDYLFDKLKMDSTTLKMKVGRIEVCDKSRSREIDKSMPRFSHIFLS
jgi:hypothetical protein